MTWKRRKIARKKNCQTKEKIRIHLDRSCPLRRPILGKLKKKQHGGCMATRAKATQA
jgi:hypothetical protein